MALIRATCPDCGDVEFDSTDIVVRLCVTDDSWSYRFPCPECNTVSVHPVTSTMASELIWVDCQVEVWEMPALDDNVGETITHDDLIDFVDSLPEFLESLLS